MLLEIVQRTLVRMPIDPCKQTKICYTYVFEPLLITDEFDSLNFRFTSEVRQQTTISMIVGAIAARKMHCKRFVG